MKKIFAIAGILALAIIPTTSFSGHLDAKESEIRPGGNLFHTNLRGRNLLGASLTGAFLPYADLYAAILFSTDLSNANLRDSNLSGCHPE